MEESERSRRKSLSFENQKLANVKISVSEIVSCKVDNSQNGKSENSANHMPLIRGFLLITSTLIFSE